MKPEWITLLTFVTAALFVGALASTMYDVFFRYHFLLNGRIDELSGRTKVGVDTALFKKLKPLAANGNPWPKQLEEYLEQSGLHIGLRPLAGISISIGILIGGATAALTHRWWLAPLAFVPGLVLPALYVRMKRATRMRRLVSQLPQAFDVIGRSVRAGQTVTAAFQIVADELESPLAEEFLYCYEQQNLGMSHDVALRGLAQRTGIVELRILAVALLVQSRTGGNLVELVSNLSTMVTKRIKIQQRVKTLTSEGRMQALVLMVLPALAFVSLLALSPGYVTTLFDYPWLLAATGGAQLVGALWIQRCVHFEY